MSSEISGESDLMVDRPMTKKRVQERLFRDFKKQQSFTFAISAVYDLSI